MTLWRTGVSLEPRRWSTDHFGVRRNPARVLALLVGLLAVAAAPAAASRDPRSPRLRPVPADVRIAKGLILLKADLPRGFHTFSSGASPNNNVGSCSRKTDPDLSALTETAEVYGAGLRHGYTGVEYVPSAYVFVSAAQASQAQRLYTSPMVEGCAVTTAKERLKGLQAKLLGQTLRLVSREPSGGVVVRGRQAILSLRVGTVKFQAEASLIFLRRGRALCEVWTSGLWDASTRRTWNDAITAVSRRLRRSRT